MWNKYIRSKILHSVHYLLLISSLLHYTLTHLYSILVMLLLSIFILPILSNFLFFRKKIHLLVGGAGRKVKKRHPEHKGNIVLILLEETEQSEEKTETKEEEHEGKNK